MRYEELRFYSFINFYLSSIQQGIQTAHLVSELMANTMNIETPAQAKVFEWADNYKTIITLNGGNGAMLRDLLKFLCDNREHWQFEFTSFSEDEDSLDGALTGVGMVLPESLFNAVYQPDTGYYRYISDDERIDITYTDGPYWELIHRIKSCRLAN